MARGTVPSAFAFLSRRTLNRDIISKFAHCIPFQFTVRYNNCDFIEHKPFMQRAFFPLSSKWSTKIVNFFVEFRFFCVFYFHLWASLSFIHCLLPQFFFLSRKAGALTNIIILPNGNMKERNNRRSWEYSSTTFSQTTLNSNHSYSYYCKYLCVL